MQKYRVMGIDPGFVDTGVAVLECQVVDNQFPAKVNRKALNVAHIKTKKISKKLRSGFRVTTDDQRRWRDIWIQLDRLWNEYKPTALGVEAYIVNPRQKGSIAGVKTMGVYVGVLYWGWSRGMYSEGFLPQDIKRRFCGRQSASKEEVGNSILNHVHGLPDLLRERKISKNAQEHIYDAVGHGILIMEDLMKMKRALGAPL